MPPGRWDAQTKALIVLEGLTGKAVAEVCIAHPSSQSQYDPWRDPFLAHAAKAFEVPQHTRREAHLEHENSRLKQLVGELTPTRSKPKPTRPNAWGASTGPKSWSRVSAGLTS